MVRLYPKKLMTVFGVNSVGSETGTQRSVREVEWSEQDHALERNCGKPSGDLEAAMARRR